MFVCPAILNLQIFPFDVSRLFEAPPNGRDEVGICTGRNAAQETDDPAGPVWLRTHGKGEKDRRAGNKCERVPPLDCKVLVQPDERCRPPGSRPACVERAALASGAASPNGTITHR